MVFVYEPMSIDIFTALGAVRGAKILDLTSTSVSDSAFERFTQFGTVEELLLNHSTITDASVTHILRFQHVRILSIYTNNLVDASVLQLGQLPELRMIFNELVGQRADLLCKGHCGPGAAEAVTTALLRESDFTEEQARDIGFHLADWPQEAAFIVALHLCPERFTPEEVEDGVLGFLVHVPNHVAAAAALFGSPVEDIFEVGALDGPANDEEPGNA